MSSAMRSIFHSIVLLVASLGLEASALAEGGAVTVDPFEIRFSIKNRGSFQVSAVQTQLICQATSGFIEPSTDTQGIVVPTELHQNATREGVEYQVRLLQSVTLKNPFKEFLKYRAKKCYANFEVTIRDPRFSTDSSGALEPIQTTFSLSASPSRLLAAIDGMELRPAYSNQDGWLREGGCFTQGTQQKCFFYLFANAFSANGQILRRGWQSKPLLLTPQEVGQIAPLQNYPFSDYLH